MRYMHFRRWVADMVIRIFPRRYCCRQLPFVQKCNCRAPKRLRLSVDLLESRESPTSLAGPNPLVSSLGISSMTSLAADRAAADATWHSPLLEHPSAVGGISNPSHETNGTLVRGSPDPAPAATEGLPQHSSPTPSETWTAFSSADFFPDPLALDFPSFTQSHARNSLSLGTLDDARSSPSDSGGSSSGSAAGNPVSAGSAGSLMFDPLNLGNGLSGLVGNGPAGGLSLAPSPPLSSSLPPGVLPLTTPVANAPGSPSTPLPTDHGLPITGNPPLTQPTTSNPPSPSTDFD